MLRFVVMMVAALAGAISLESCDNASQHRNETYVVLPIASAHLTNDTMGRILMSFEIRLPTAVTIPPAGDPLNPDADGFATFARDADPDAAWHLVGISDIAPLPQYRLVPKRLAPRANRVAIHAFLFAKNHTMHTSADYFSPPRDLITTLETQPCKNFAVRVRVGDDGSLGFIKLLETRVRTTGQLCADARKDALIEPP